MVRRKILGVLVSLAVVAFAVTASAGFRASYPVFVSASARYAFGSLGSTRASSDTNAELGCSLNSNGALCCFASDSTGAQSECCNSSPTPQMAAAVGSLNGDSYMYFTWDANNDCTYIIVENASMFLPKPQ